MKKWPKEKALDILSKRKNEIEIVIKNGRGSEEHTRWVSNTLRVLEEIFGANSRYYLTISSYSWSDHGQMIIHDIRNFNYYVNQKQEQAFRSQMIQAKGVLNAAIDHLNDSEIDEVYEGKNSGPESSEIIKIINIVEDKLRKIIREDPKREKEIQDSFENLLILSSIEYKREFPAISYSSKNYIPDFSIDKLDLVIEIKFCNSDTREKELISEINDDILAYGTKYGNLLFVIYDMGKIRDIDKFKESIEKNINIIVKVIKH